MFVSFEIDENLLEKITFRKSFIREYLKKNMEKGNDFLFGVTRFF